MSSLPERLKTAREKLGLSQQQVADAVGMAQPSYYQLETGKSKRSRFIHDIAKAVKVDAEWLLNGGEQTAVTDNPLLLSDSNDMPAHTLIGNQSEYKPVRIRYFNIKASCGDGYANDEYPESHTQLFTVEFLRANQMPIDGAGLLLMHACSDSMGYTIPHGTLILVDTNAREFDNFINNKVYVFKADSEMICKRAIRNLNGTVLLKSDNADKALYPDQLVDRETFSQFDMFGRVRYTFAKH